MVARTDEKQAEAEQDKRRIYAAIHRDMAYAIASQSEAYAPAVEHLRQYVVGHIGVHGKLPSDIDDVYDKMVLFDDNEWVPTVPEKAASPEAMQVVSGARYHPTVWNTPADLTTYDAALQSSTQQIENLFGGALAADPTVPE